MYKGVKILRNVVRAYENLSAAVVMRAVLDYEWALRNPMNEMALKIISDCERFFMNEITMYSELDGKVIMKVVRKKVEKEQKGGEKRSSFKYKF